MEGALILVVFIVIAFGIVGGVFWLIASKLRRKQLAAGGDRATPQPAGGRSGFEDETAEQEPHAPAHTPVANEQRTRFVGRS